jgi:membrane-associated protein
LPIFRTLAPFVAGVGKMDYRRFFLFNLIGGILWVGIFVFGGYFLGKIPFVEQNLTLIIIAIIILSVLPIVIRFLMKKK